MGSLRSSGAARDSGSAGGMRGAGREREEILPGREQPNKASVTAPGSFQPEEFTLQLGKPRREPRSAGSAAPRAPGALGDAGCSAGGGSVSDRFPSPNVPPRKKCPVRGKARRSSVPPTERCHRCHRRSCHRCHRRAFRDRSASVSEDPAPSIPVPLLGVPLPACQPQTPSALGSSLISGLPCCRDGFIEGEQAGDAASQQVTFPPCLCPPP